MGAWRLSLGVLVMAGAAAAQAQKRSLGPADGHDLSPFDTGRVVIGASAPDFTLTALNGGVVKLSSLRGRKHVVLVFYRGHW